MFFVAAYQGQVLELCVLQVHLYLWRDECAEHGRGGLLVRLVLHPRLPAPHGTTMQEQVRICK